LRPSLGRVEWIEDLPGVAAMTGRRQTGNREIKGAQLALLATALGVIAATFADRASTTKPSSSGPPEHGAEATVSPNADSSARFAAMLERSMSTMHDSMRVALTRHRTSVDSAYAAAMIVHHQGAIDMARAELRFGHSEQLRRLAQEIIVTQEQEIAVMRRAIGLSVDSTTRIVPARNP
jgi:uncharacterized protein (DUF305 family)